MRKLSILPLLVVCAVYCGGGPSNGDVQDATAGIKSVYQEFFDLLEENKADPNTAVAEGEKFIESKKDELKEYGRVLGKISNQEQYDMVQAFQSEVQDLARASNQKLRPSFAGNQAAVQKLGQLMDKLGNYYVSGAEESEGMASKAAKSAGRAAAKKIMIETAKQSAGSVPEAGREQMLDTWAESLAAQGADEAEQKEFREELKNELGW